MYVSIIAMYVILVNISNSPMERQILHLTESKFSSSTVPLLWKAVEIRSIYDGPSWNQSESKNIFKNMHTKDLCICKVPTFWEGHKNLKKKIQLCFDATA